MLKPTMLFDDQMKQLLAWFSNWSACDQTNALCTLLTKLTATQSKFLSLVLDNTLKNGHDMQDLARMESDANNPAFMSSLHHESEDVALQYLLSHILLLHPGNSAARSEYLKLLTKILFGSEDEEYLCQCRQLLSLALIHPAFPPEDREKLNFWLTRLEEKRRKLSERSGFPEQSSLLQPAATLNGGRRGYVNLQTLSLPRNSSPQTSPLKKVYQTNIGQSDDNKSNTLGGSSNRIYITFPQSSAGLPSTNGFETFDSMGEINTYPSDREYENVRKGFTGSSNTLNHHQTLPHMDHHCPTPDSFHEYVVQSTSKSSRKKCVTLPIQRPSSVCSLPTNLDDQTTSIGFLKAGMKDVPVWLRTLRLHKYQGLFADMSYEELLSISEEFLESKDVTKGARKKILTSIKTLLKRQEKLRDIEQELEKPGNLLICIKDLTQVLLTPIKPYHPTEDNITSNSGSQPIPVAVAKDGVSNNRDSNVDASSISSNEGSPRREQSHMDEGSSGDSSSCSSPPSSPRLNRSSSLSSVEDILTKDFPHEDLPSLILKGLGKVFTQLMMHVDTNEDNLTAFIKALDIAMCHEGFEVSHKRKFFDWKQQCQQTLQVISPSPRKSPRSRGWPNSYTIGGTPPHPSGNTIERPRNCRRINNRGSGSQKPGYATTSILGSPRSVSTLPRANPRQQIQQPLPPPFYPPRSRSASVNSAPIPVPPLVKGHGYVNVPIPSEVSEIRYMDETHELCKSMTEHALEDQ